VAAERGKVIRKKPPQNEDLVWNPGALPPEAVRFQSANEPLRTPRVDHFAFLYEGLHPAEDADPSHAVTLGLLYIAGDSFMTDFNQGAGADALRAAMLEAVHVASLKLTADGSLQQVGKTWVPGIDEQSGAIYFQILAVDGERFAVSAKTSARPFAAGAKIGLVFHHAIQALSPHHFDIWEGQ